MHQYHTDVVFFSSIKTCYLLLLPFLPLPSLQNTLLSLQSSALLFTNVLHTVNPGNNEWATAKSSLKIPPQGLTAMLYESHTSEPMLIFTVSWHLSYRVILQRKINLILGVCICTCTFQSTATKTFLIPQSLMEDSRYNQELEIINRCASVLKI